MTAKRLLRNHQLVVLGLQKKAPSVTPELNYDL